MNKSLSSKRVLIVSALLLATAGLLQARGRVELLPKAAELELIPFQIDTWHGTTEPLSSGVREVLGDGHFLSRLYSSPVEQPVDLFIAYYSSQRSGDTIHSPKNCLPGSGWMPLESDRVWIEVAPNQSIRVNRYVVAQGMDRQLVMYWYQAHGRATPSEYAAKFYLVADSIRMNRSDGGMVRLVTPILPNETLEQSQARAVRFARGLYPMLNDYIPK
jgi:EpsI family protein